MKIANAYDIVEQLLKKGKTYISENELDDYVDGKIILAILQSKYNAKYISPYDLHFCGGYAFDNPYLTKKEYYKLEYCFFDFDKWECSWMHLVDDKSYEICKDIVRLDIGDNDLYHNEERAEECEQTEKDIFNYILQNKVFVGKKRFWRIRKILDY